MERREVLRGGPYSTISLSERARKEGTGCRIGTERGRHQDITISSNLVSARTAGNVARVAHIPPLFEMHELTSAENQEPEHEEHTKRRRLSPLVQNDRHDKIKIKKEGYEASAHKLHKTDVTDVDDEMEVLRRKKLKLLRDNDWLGLNLQEPLKLKYAPTGVDDNIGKRRRLKPGHEARYDKSHVRLSPARHDNYDNRSEVRVTIDGKERRVGVSSSAAPSKGTAPPISSQSSDVMLMENDGGSPESDASQFPNGQHEKHQHRRRSQSYRDDHKEREINHRVKNKHTKGDTPLWEDLSRLAEEPVRDAKLKDDQTSFSSSSIRRMAEARGLTVQDYNGDQFKSLFSSSQQHPSSQALPSLQWDTHVMQPHGAQTRNIGRLIMPSSPPVLHHPVPKRGPPQILRTNSLDIASSAAATIGELSKLTVAENEGDKMWKEWLDADAAYGSDESFSPDEEYKEQSPARSITPGISQYVPHRAAAQSPQGSRQSESVGATAESGASTRSSDESMPHNMMQLSSSVNSNIISAVGTPSAHIQAVTSRPTIHPIIRPRQAHMSPPTQIRQRVSPPLPDAGMVQPIDDDTAWKSFLRSPSELKFDAESLRPFQKPPIRRPRVQGKPKRKTADPDAAWKSFVLTDESDSEEDNAAFNSFWKKNDKKAPAQSRRVAQQAPSSSYVPLEVHAPASMGPPKLPHLPSSRPATTTPVKLKSHAPFLSSSMSAYFNDTQVLDDRSINANQGQASSMSGVLGTQVQDDRSMYANQSQMSSTTGDFEPHVTDDRSMYVNRSMKSSSSVSSGPVQLNTRTGQATIKLSFKPPSKLHAQAPLGHRDRSTFKRRVPFGTPQKAGKQSLVDGLDKKYVQEANRELRKELWKKPNGMRRDDTQNEGRGKQRRTKSIWDIPSSDDDNIEEI